LVTSKQTERQAARLFASHSGGERPRALKHLEALQKIADEHGRKRAAGTPGYDASVEYVVDVLRDIGFRVSTPTFESAGEDGEGLSVRQRNVIAQTRTGDPTR
jgi:hypothetical protein